MTSGARDWPSHSAASASRGTIESPDPGTGADIAHDPGTDDEEPAQDLSGIQDPVRASSSSSPDEVVAGALAAPIPDDSRVQQELLCRVTKNMRLQAEEIVEGVGPYGGYFNT